MEIGSDFWQVELSNKKNDFFESLEKDTRFFSTGRDALKFIIRDIKMSKKVPLRVSIPSFCCESMIEPFINENIDIQFYPVVLDSDEIVINYDNISDCDIVLVANYFGFNLPQVEEMIRNLKRKNKIIIQDVTQCIIDKTKWNLINTDYIYGSIRKWSGFIGGGFACKTQNNFSFREEVKINVNNDWEEIRQEAIIEKKSYIDGKSKNKRYLEKFKLSENILDNNSEIYQMNDKDINSLKYWNIDIVSTKRRENGQFLYKKLVEIPSVFPLFDLQNSDLPLFVPIIFKTKSLRDLTRKFLIENEIYCPVHWPISKLHNLNDSEKWIYERELSLICDQRYSIEDMERQINALQSFLEVNA